MNLHTMNMKSVAFRSFMLNIICKFLMKVMQFINNHREQFMDSLAHDKMRQQTAIVDKRHLSMD